MNPENNGISVVKKVYLILILQILVTLAISVAGIYTYYFLRGVREAVENYDRRRSTLAAAVAATMARDLAVAEALAGDGDPAEPPLALAEAGAQGEAALGALAATLAPGDHVGELRHRFADHAVWAENVIGLIAADRAGADRLYRGRFGSDRAALLAATGRLGELYAADMAEYRTESDDHSHVLRQIIIALTVVGVIMSVVLSRVVLTALERRLGVLDKAVGECLALNERMRVEVEEGRAVSRGTLDEQSEKLAAVASELSVVTSGAARGV